MVKSYFWIALEKSDKKNGAMYYFNGSHKIGLVNHVASNIKGSSQTVKDVKIYSKYHKITPSLNAGDALVHDSYYSLRYKNNSKKIGWD